MLKTLKAMAKFNWHLSNLVAFISLNHFIKINLQDWLDNPFELYNRPPKNIIQWILIRIRRIHYTFFNKNNTFISKKRLGQG